MKKLCVWALAAMMTVGATGAMADHLDDIKAKGKLVVGSEVSFAPFEFYFVGEDGKEYEAGFEMELARQIAADIGVELEVSDQQFNGLIPALQNGDVDLVLSGMTVTESTRTPSISPRPITSANSPSSFAKRIWIPTRPLRI